MPLGTATNPMPLTDLGERLTVPSQVEALSPLTGMPYVVVDAAGADCNLREPEVAQPACPVVAIVSPNAAQLPNVADVAVAHADQATEVVDAIQRNPIASMVLVRLLRHNDRVGIGDRLFAESLAYSTLQHGAEFETWLSARKLRASRPHPGTPAVLLDRAADELRVTLNRPSRRNAYSTELRDALCEALEVAVADQTVAKVVVDGVGPCFSAGGDLDEFGEARDAGVAHASRMVRSAASLLHRLRDRVEARVHGACIGAGIELPAFAGQLTARADAFFQLPEVGMGLIPGAGGTASILPRIGRQRLALMALTGMRVDAETALAWGLIDAIEG